MKDTKSHLTFSRLKAVPFARGVGVAAVLLGSAAAVHAATAPPPVTFTSGEVLSAEKLTTAFGNISQTLEDLISELPTFSIEDNASARLHNNLSQGKAPATAAALSATTALDKYPALFLTGDRDITTPPNEGLQIGTWDPDTNAFSEFASFNPGAGTASVQGTVATTVGFRAVNEGGAFLWEIQPDAQSKGLNVLYKPNGGNYQYNAYFKPDKTFVNNGTIVSGADISADNGDVYAKGVKLSSDARLKKNVETATHALDMVLALRGVYFDWIDQTRAAGRQLGFIAQEVESIVPEVVVTAANGFKAVAYANLTALLVEALKQEVQERQADAMRLEARIEALEKALGAETARRVASEAAIIDVQRRLKRAGL